MSDVVICLMGPTACGKTALAMQLVQQFPLEIISVDSAMVYREMDIGTAKPTMAELQLAPHHLINMIDPPESYSAARFCTDVTTVIRQVQAKAKIPLLVGGTMMYFNALQNGLDNMPDADAAIRTRLEQQAALQGWPALHAKLSEVDPKAAKRIHAHDTQRIQRALEVYELTGQPLSTMQQAQKNTGSLHFINFCLQPENRANLHAQIEARFHAMLEQGLIEEVKNLQNKWTLTSNHPAMRCVGYRQALEHLSGLYDYTTFVDKGIAATRQLAKRQLTWLRHWPDGETLICDDGLVQNTLMAKIQKILDNIPR